MKLKDHTEISLGIIRTWEKYWKKFSTDKQHQDILKHFENEEADQVGTAVQHHLEDYTPTTNGNRIGTFPPSIADIRGHLEEMAEKEHTAKKARETAKKYLEETPENQNRATQVFNKLDWRALIGQHQAKRAAIIAHLRQTQRLDFSQGIDREAFRPVQAAIFETNSELAPEDAAEIFRAARLPDANWTDVEEKCAKEFLKKRKNRAIKAPSIRSGMDGLARWPGLREG